MSHPSISDLALRCIGCGFCLDACPTYRLTGSEAHSPRGRIRLMQAVDQGDLPLDRETLERLDVCLGCRACETACPSGVEYSAMLEAFRGRAHDAGVREPAESAARAQLLRTLTTPARLGSALRGARAAGLDASRSLPAPVAQALTGGAHHSVTLPATEVPGSARLPERSPALGTERRTVGVLAGCAMRVLYAPVNAATVRVLQHNGCTVLAPRGAGCCGALHVHAGDHAEARILARALLDAFEGCTLDAFVVNSAGCGSTVKEYGRLLGDDPTHADAAHRMASIARDFCEFLDEVGPAPFTHEVRVTVAYHDACHLAHGQRVVAAPRRLLAAVPGLTLVDLPHADTCCGSAGIYNLTQPTMARRLLDEKIDAIESTGASVVVAGNPGCLAWIKQGLRERGLDVQARHPAEILDAAYGGPGLG